MKEGDNALYVRDKIYNLTEKVIFLLDDFDKNLSFGSADEDFFKKLDDVIMG
ncbi:hypothetical protein ALNOE001_18550 [Candidatus Methanobinarius endosymbioticus]|uniref:Uncharacterized protein n=1 Tax=Candidatus Methanobinarius endosymbioticus TaxID=2006182 RepID=A0A366MAH0_9EURY|nr:hypothetical protein ALNOE001_18550 [Candidatus Methanobinarius endosymbioticus]